MRAIGWKLSLVLLLSAGWTGGAQSQDCPTPTVSSVSVDPTEVLGGNETAFLQVNLSHTVPYACTYWLMMESSHPQVISPFGPGILNGNGTDTELLTASPKVVNATTGVTLTVTALTGHTTNLVVGESRSTDVTVTPMGLSWLSFDSVDTYEGETIHGKVALDGVVTSPYDAARVNLSSNAVSALGIPAYVDVSCCSLLNGHSVATFDATGLAVPEDTDVVVTASRAGESVTDSVTVKTGSPPPPPPIPICNVKVELWSVVSTHAEPAGVVAEVRNIGKAQCPQTALSMTQSAPVAGTRRSGPSHFITQALGKRPMKPVRLDGPATLPALEHRESYGAKYTMAWAKTPTTFRLAFGEGFPGIAPEDPSLTLVLE